MPSTTPDDLVTPNSTDLYDYVVDMAALADSIQDAFDARITIQKVADMAGRTAYLAEFTTAFGSPTTSNPCVVFRSNASPGMQLEFDDGTGFKPWVTRVPPTTQIFTSSGTYTAPAGLLYAVVEVVGGGGGAGGAAVSAAGGNAVAGGGGGGGYAKKTILAATIGASQAVTVGTGGPGGAAGANAGTVGVTSSFGSLLTATGGAAGQAGAATTATMVMRSGGAGGTGTLGDINLMGEEGAAGLAGTDVWLIPATGGSSGLALGAGARHATVSGVGAAGSPGSIYGGGGSGAYNRGSSGTPAKAGGAGANGVVIVTEYF